MLRLRPEHQNMKLEQRPGQALGEDAGLFAVRSPGFWVRAPARPPLRTGRLGGEGRAHVCAASGVSPWGWGWGWGWGGGMFGRMIRTEPLSLPPDEDWPEQRGWVSAPQPDED